ncbi:M121 protein [Murid betaherpesvirus 1]|nr:M121 protein [Murid betaherpesvirus 1]
MRVPVDTVLLLAVGCWALLAPGGGGADSAAQVTNTWCLFIEEGGTTSVGEEGTGEYPRRDISVSVGNTGCTSDASNVTCETAENGDFIVNYENGTLFCEAGPHVVNITVLRMLFPSQGEALFCDKNGTVSTLEWFNLDSGQDAPPIEAQFLPRIIFFLQTDVEGATPCALCTSESDTLLCVYGVLDPEAFADTRDIYSALRSVAGRGTSREQRPTPRYGAPTSGSKRDDSLSLPRASTGAARPTQEQEKVQKEQELSLPSGWRTRLASDLGARGVSRVTDPPQHRGPTHDDVLQPATRGTGEVSIPADLDLQAEGVRGGAGRPLSSSAASNSTLSLPQRGNDGSPASVLRRSPGNLYTEPLPNNTSDPKVPGTPDLSQRHVLHPQNGSGRGALSSVVRADGGAPSARTPSLPVSSDFAREGRVHHQSSVPTRAAHARTQAGGFARPAGLHGPPRAGEPSDSETAASSPAAIVPADGRSSVRRRRRREERSAGYRLRRLLEATATSNSTGPATVTSKEVRSQSVSEANGSPPTPTSVQERQSTSVRLAATGSVNSSAAGTNGTGATTASGTVSSKETSRKNDAVGTSAKSSSPPKSHSVTVQASRSNTPIGRPATHTQTISVVDLLPVVSGEPEIDTHDYPLSVTDGQVVTPQVGTWFVTHPLQVLLISLAGAVLLVWILTSLAALLFRRTRSVY